MSMEIQSGPVFILTGAGFTKNFGGLLGSEMWAEIFNNPRIQVDSDLREILAQDYDYESAYSQIIESSLPEEKKQVMREVALEAYKNLDDVLKGWIFNDSSAYPVNRYLLADLIGRVYAASPRPAKAFMFTLNQDLFMERHWNWNSPGVPRVARFQNGFDSQSFNANDFVELSADNAEARLQKGLENHAGIHYIKLHGSYGWKSSDGANQLVVGTSKETLIQREPLLRAYFDLFQSVIKEGSKKVLLIGYGFRDTHINAALVDGVQNHGLEVYILTPGGIADLRRNMENGHYYALDILNKGLRGYFQKSLLDVFPKNQDRTPHYDEMLQALGI